MMEGVGGTLAWIRRRCSCMGMVLWEGGLVEGLLGVLVLRLVLGTLGFDKLVLSTVVLDGCIS